MNSRNSRKKAGTSDSGGTPKEDRRGIQFPWKLHEMLEQVERDDHSHIVSWLPDGKSFRVHKKEEFCNNIMPMWFNSSKYKTWQRNLNLWGFKSVVRGPAKGDCFHPAFLRGYPDLCKNMIRIKVKESFQETAHLPNHEAVNQPKDPHGVLNRLPPEMATIMSNYDVGLEGAFSSNISAISDFLRGKTNSISADALLEVELERRLASAQLLHLLPPIDLVPHGNLGSSQRETLRTGPGHWQESHLMARQWVGSGILRSSTTMPQNLADHLLSVFNLAVAAMHIIQQEEVEIFRRRHS